MKTQTIDPRLNIHFATGENREAFRVRECFAVKSIKFHLFAIRDLYLMLSMSVRMTVGMAINLSISIQVSLNILGSVLSRALGSQHLSLNISLGGTLGASNIAFDEKSHEQKREWGKIEYVEPDGESLSGSIDTWNTLVLGSE